MPAVADAEGRGPDAQAPRKVEPAANLSDGGVDELEVVGLAEPRAERVGDCFGSLQVHRTGRQHRPEVNCRAQRGGHPGVIAVGEGLEEDAAERPACDRVGVLLCDD